MAICSTVKYTPERQVYGRRHLTTYGASRTGKTMNAEDQVDTTGPPFAGFAATLRWSASISGLATKFDLGGPTTAPFRWPYLPVDTERGFVVL